MSLELAMWVLLVLTCVIGVVNAFRFKMRELEMRDARATAATGRYRPNPARAAARHPQA